MASRVITSIDTNSDAGDPEAKNCWRQGEHFGKALLHACLELIISFGHLCHPAMGTGSGAGGTSCPSVLQPFLRSGGRREQEGRDWRRVLGMRVRC